MSLQQPENERILLIAIMSWVFICRHFECLNADFYSNENQIQMLAYLCVCQRPVYQKVYDHYPHVRFHTSLPFPRLKHLPHRDQLHLSWGRNPERRSPLMPERVSFWQSFLKKFPELRCKGSSAFDFIPAHKNPTFRLRLRPSHLRR